jgi:hypothetical protein
VQIADAADGVASGFHGQISSSGDAVRGTTGVAGLSADSYYTIDGSILCSGSGNMDVFYSDEALNGVLLRAGATGIIWAFA